MTIQPDEKVNEVKTFFVRGEYSCYYSRNFFDMREYEGQTADEAIDKAKGDGLIKLISCREIILSKEIK